MPISNSQYDAIMRIYSEKQQRNRHLTEERQRSAYHRSPRLREIDNEIASASVAAARKLLAGDLGARENLQSSVKALRREKELLLRQLDLPCDYLAPVYDCPDCKDTGYIKDKKCHCMEQAIIDTVYSQSNMHSILERENFSKFTYAYYSNEKVDPATGLTSLETAKATIGKCRCFISEFETAHDNLLFYGSTGVGKTFLTNCIAKEILDRGHSVVYFTAFQLFELFSKGVFERDADAVSAHQNIFDCDLLIIDDLGTELPNSFTSSQLFLCINERILRQKSTIISTNLSMGQLLNLYSERTMSRIYSKYTLCKLYGDDIRLKKRK